MKCSNDGCDGALRVSHTYSTNFVKFQRAQCPGCGRVYCLSTIAIPQPARGEGAKARFARAQLDMPCATSPSPS